MASLGIIPYHPVSLCTIIWPLHANA